METKNNVPDEQFASHTPMPVWKRAKQFMPFSAVEGLEEALHRKEEELEEYDSIEHIPGEEFVDF